jgi:subtilase family serine protease
MASDTAPTTNTSQSGMPDLDIIDVSGNLDLAVGEPLALQVTVHNHGPGASDKPALVRLTLGDGMATESYVPPMPAGGQVVIAVSLSHVFSQEAELDVGIAVDPDGEISEEFEDNNATSVRLKVTYP